MHFMTYIWLLFPLAGLFTGFLAGLLGIGGAIILVPLLVTVFTQQHFPAEHIFVMAVGTTFANILFTSFSSVITHHRRGGVLWPVCKNMAPGIIAGTLAGTVLAAHSPGKILEIIFICFLFWVGTRMLFKAKETAPGQLPGQWGMAGVGVAIGSFCSLVGAGGGSLVVPFLSRSNVKFTQAIGTAAALGFPIALAGVAGYIFNGLWISGLPSYSLGYVYLPALVGLTVASMITAPLGALLAHRLPVAQLRKIFALMLYAVVILMTLDLF
jgi:uncharacterized membrane protein YfcA